MRDDTRRVTSSNSWRMKKVKADASWRLQGSRDCREYRLFLLETRLLLSWVKHPMLFGKGYFCRHHHVVSWFILIFNAYLYTEQFTHCHLTGILRRHKVETISLPILRCRIFFCRRTEYCRVGRIIGSHAAMTLSALRWSDESNDKEKSCSYHSPICLVGREGLFEERNVGRASPRQDALCHTCHKLLHDDHARAQSGSMNSQWLWSTCVFLRTWFPGWNMQGDSCIRYSIKRNNFSAFKQGRIK